VSRYGAVRFMAQEFADARVDNAYITCPYIRHDSKSATDEICRQKARRGYARV